MAQKSICLYFQVHQPTRLRLFRFFDIGKESHYYDEFKNRTILRRIAQISYLPANNLLLELIGKYGKDFKVAFSISGSLVEQLDRYAPEVLDSFRKLADTGCVEFLSETYYHSLSSLSSPNEFRHQVLKHRDAIKRYFGQTPQAFRNTELIYSDSIGAMVHEMGFNTMLAEGARQVLGWKSPNYLYSCSHASGLSLLLRNSSLSDDIAFRFSDRNWDNWPLTADKYVSWLKSSINDGQIINLFMDYETFGEHQKASSGIFDFMRYLPGQVLAEGGFEFVTPSEASRKHSPVGVLDCPEVISWADEERDVTAWLGNELQNDAFEKINALQEKLALVNDESLWSDFGHLQESDHFYYMCTKFFSDGAVHSYFNPYNTPYEAFINYMNVLSDFSIRVDDELKSNLGTGRNTHVSKVSPVRLVKPVRNTTKTLLKDDAGSKAETKTVTAKKSTQTKKKKLTADKPKQ